MAKIDGIEVFVTEENPEFDNESTDQPVEAGADITDHVKASVDRYRIRGKITGPDAANKFTLLRKIRREGKPVKYLGRNYLTRVIIDSLSTEHDKNIVNGFRFSMTLKQIRVARPTPLQPLPPEVSTQAKGVTNKGRQQVQDL